MKSFDAKSTKLLFSTRPPRGAVCEVEFTHVGLAQSLFAFLSAGSMGGHLEVPTFTLVLALIFHWPSFSSGQMRMKCVFVSIPESIIVCLRIFDSLPKDF